MVTVVDSCFCDSDLFFSCTVERLSQGRPCRGPAKGCEGNWLFSYHSRHSTHILFLLQGPVTLMHTSQESLTSSQPHIVFSFVFNINWIPEGYVTPFNCMHDTAGQEDKYYLLIVKSVVVFYKGLYITHCHVIWPPAVYTWLIYKDQGSAHRNACISSGVSSSWYSQLWLHKCMHYLPAK